MKQIRYWGPRRSGVTCELHCFLAFFPPYLWTYYIFVVKNYAENIRFNRTEYATRDSRSFVFELEKRGRVPSQINSEVTNST